MGSGFFFILNLNRVTDHPFFVIGVGGVRVVKNVFWLESQKREKLPDGHFYKKLELGDKSGQPEMSP